MTTETDLCPIELSWATFQRKVPSSGNDGMVQYATQLNGA